MMPPKNRLKVHAIEFINDIQSIDDKAVWKIAALALPG